MTVNVPRKATNRLAAALDRQGFDYYCVEDHRTGTVDFIIESSLTSDGEAILMVLALNCV
jgi:alkanesulfonate monooxygenase SsuD/methylene tetrahydromethanopterin reductase-like flavin-dependent oxidoreductase (luciferase family)